MKECHANQTGIEAYSLLTEYLDSDQKEKLRKQLYQWTCQEEQIQAISRKIDQGDWAVLLSSEENHFPAQALACLHGGKIKTMQYVTSQMFYNVLSAPENKGKQITVEKIFNKDGALIRNSMNKIEATMKLVSSSFHTYITTAVNQAKEKEQGLNWQRFFSDSQKPTEADMQNRLLSEVDLTLLEESAKVGHKDWDSDKERNAFYQELKKMPKSEQAFLLMDDPLFNGYDVTNDTSVTQQINYRLGFNVFSRLRVNGQPKLMIPSIGMIQAYLKVTRPNSHTPAVYRFGLSPLEGLYKTMRSGRRDQVICCALLPELTPSHADSFSANPAWAEAEMHDFYHLVLSSSIPQKHRELFVQFIDEFQNMAADLPSTQIYLNTMREIMIDLEHRAYDRNISKSLFLKTFQQMNLADPDSRFWLTLDNIDQFAAIKLLQKANPGADVPDYRKKHEKNRHLVAVEIANWLLIHEQLFFSKFGMDCRKILTYSSKDNSFISLIQEELKRILTVQKNKITKELLSLLSSEVVPESSMITIQRYQVMLSNNSKSLLLKDAIKQAVIELLDEKPIDAMRIIYQLKSPLLLGVLHESLTKNMVKHIESGIMAQFEQLYPEQYQYIISAFRKSDGADKLMNEALDMTRMGKENSIYEEIIDRLYPHDNLNRVYSSDHRTLLQRALRSENAELMLRLTNDGASVTEVPDARKPCPLIESQLQGRYELIALLTYGYQYGRHWMNKFPEEVAHIRRLAASYAMNYVNYPDVEEDEKWAKERMLEVMPRIPKHLLSSIDVEKTMKEIEKTSAGVHRFLDRLNTKGHMTLDINDPDTEAFGRSMKWRNQGGPIPLSSSIFSSESSSKESGDEAVNATDKKSFI